MGYLCVNVPWLSVDAWIGTGVSLGRKITHTELRDNIADRNQIAREQLAQRQDAKTLGSKKRSRAEAGVDNVQVDLKGVLTFLDRK